MPQTLPRRLPGFRFETQASLPDDVLPRMDIGVVVGFAGAGPIDLPVRIESTAQFEMIFGSDLALASTPEGTVVRAHLAHAVREFFRHGGQRCWIIRVAGTHAGTSRFPLPGVLQVRGSELQPAFACARSPGSGFDTTRLATSLVSRSLEPADPFVPATLRSRIIQDGRTPIVPGDTLRWTFHADGVEAITQVIAVTRPAILPAPRRETVELHFESLHWFAWPATRQPATDAAILTFHRGPSDVRSWTGSLISAPESASPASLQWPERFEDRTVELMARIPVSELPQVGSLLRIDLGGDVLFLRLDSVAGAEDPDSPTGASARLSGEARWWLPSAPVTASTPTAERLAFELRTRSTGTNPIRLTDLTFANSHPRCWNALPPDSELFLEFSFAESLRSAEAMDREDLWQSAADPRTPIAGNGIPGADFIPLLMPTLPEPWMDRVADSTDALVRDGLENYGAGLFLDPDLIEPTSIHLAESAEFIRFQSSTPRRLKGIHAAFGVEEATWIAVPDAVHSGWKRTAGDDPEPGVAPPNPEWAWGEFLRCATEVPDAPILELASAPDTSGSFRLAWTPSDPDATATEVREGTLPDLATASVLYTGPALDLTVYGRTPGTYYYVARSLNGDQPGIWSNVIAVRVGAAGRWQTAAWSEASTDQLLALQRSLLRVCAARGDLLAILSLPGDWHSAEALDHLARLRTDRGNAIEVDAAGSPLETKACLPLGTGELPVLSYGAMYHSWPLRRDPGGTLHPGPPDGAIAGLMAARSLARGAWVAPANDPLREVIALQPVLSREDWPALQEAQLNFLRQDAWGFRCLAADTLSVEPELRPINVRRLLQLLRRVALKLGATYVFEPMNDAFLRTVQHGFERLMLQLYARGAFAGRTPSEAFQVNTGPSVNPPASRELGRFVVEIKVAPALPLRFLTLRLVQTGDRAEITETA